MIYMQWNLSNLDTNGVEESVIVSEVSSFQRLQEWYLGWEMVSCLERCPQFRSVLIEREVPLYIHISYTSLCIAVPLPLLCSWPVQARRSQEGQWVRPKHPVIYS